MTDKEDNQIDSSSRPAPQESAQIITSAQQAAPTAQVPQGLPNWSSMNLLSLDLYEMMKQILLISDINDNLKTEDMTYISQSLNWQKVAKQFLIQGKLEMNIFYSNKASKTIDQLYNTRREAHEEYQILLAPFYFKKGDALAMYVEENMDEMNNLKPLELPGDPDDVDQLSQIDEVASKEDEPAIVDKTQNGDDRDDGEPQIEEVANKAENQIQTGAATDDIVKDLNEDVGAKDQPAAGNEFEELSEDILTNFSLALQIIDDFINGRNIKEQLKNKFTPQVKKDRKSLLSSLLIDCTLRQADYAKFYQDVPCARAHYDQVIELCQEFPKGNERILGSAHFSLGVLLLEMNIRDQANTHFVESQKIQMSCLVNALEANGQQFDGFYLKKHDEKLKIACEPSIFDNDKTKDLKVLINEISEYMKECVDAALIQPQLEQMKKEAEKRKEEGFGVEGDAPKGFNEMPKDAETFAKVTIKFKSKKRSQQEASDQWKKNEEENGKSIAEDTKPQSETDGKLGPSNGKKLKIDEEIVQNDKENNTAKINQ